MHDKTTYHINERGKVGFDHKICQFVDKIQSRQLLECLESLFKSTDGEQTIFKKDSKYLSKFPVSLVIR